MITNILDSFHLSFFTNRDSVLTFVVGYISLELLILPLEYLVEHFFVLVNDLRKSCHNPTQQIK